MAELRRDGGPMPPPVPARRPASARSGRRIDRVFATVACACLLWAFGARAETPGEGSEAALAAHKAATHLYKSGKFAKAAEFYHTAWSIDGRPAYLFNAARAEQRAMMLDKAEAHFRQCLALSTLDEQTRARAKMHLQEVVSVRQAIAAAKAEGEARERSEEDKRKAAAAKEGDSVRPKGERGQQPAGGSGSSPGAGPGDGGAPEGVETGAGGWKRPVGWAALGLGAVATGAGAWLLSGYLSDQDALDARQKSTDEAGLVDGIAYDDYASEQRGLWSRRRLALATGATGLVCVGAGAWLLLTGPGAALSVGPAASLRGAWLALRF